MISDEDVKRLFRNGQRVLANHPDERIDLNKKRYSQFYRGISAHNWENQPPGACKRHMSALDKFNIIPKYCFDCYKVLFKPRTVVDLFKLMVVFEKLELPADNTRKCMVETRAHVSGTYKALIYCRSMEEGREIIAIVQKIILDEILEKIPVTLKRGCTAYALAYPEYAQTEQGTTAMEYKEEWRKYEELNDKSFVVDTQHSVTNTHNHPAYTLQDARIMLVWLRFAATAGDLSYLRISGRTLQPFRPGEDE